jgi:hypothetical protein
MVVQARRRRGRHARDGGLPGLLAPMARSRRARVALGGAAGTGLVVIAALAVAGSGRVPRAAAVNVLARRQPSLPAASSAPPARLSRGAGDQAAMAYYRANDSADAAHVGEILWTGPMLRVYTDLPGSQADSRTAIALCETAAAYLQGRGRIPAVFVHADRAAGYPVLANKLYAGDDCRLNSVP